MGFESNTGLNVSNHYGQRQVGGEEGLVKTEGAGNEAALDYDGDVLGKPVVVPAGAVVTQVLDDFATGAITAATVGAVDISGADGAAINYVPVPAGGELVVTGPTAGKVVVKYMFVKA